MPPIQKRLIRYAICSSVTAGALCAWYALAFANDTAAFPDGFDAVQAAPDSHNVLFENALVRVLQVTIPPTGKSEPMHHHRWPSIFISWDTGGRTSHIRYHTPNGAVRDIPSNDTPNIPGHWSIHWMNPEPMHAIEAVENNVAGGDVPLLRVEIKLPAANSS